MRRNVSSDSVENVVYAPRNPISSVDRTHGATTNRSVKTVNSNPARKAPVTLTTNVPQGKADGTRRDTTPSSPYRARAPTAPARATPRAVRTEPKLQL